MEKEFLEEEPVTEIEVTEENIEEIIKEYGEIPEELPERPVYEEGVENETSN